MGPQNGAPEDVSSSDERETSTRGFGARLPAGLGMICGVSVHVDGNAVFTTVIGKHGSLKLPTRSNPESSEPHPRGQTFPVDLTIDTLSEEEFGRSEDCRPNRPERNVPSSATCVA